MQQCPTERSELVAARRRIDSLEAELAAERRAKQLLKEAVPPKARFAIIKVMVAEGHSIKVSCRVLQVTEAGFYAWRKRPPSERAIRHAWLTDLITKAHVDSRGTYGVRRVRAELTIGMGIVVSSQRRRDADASRQACRAFRTSGGSAARSKPRRRRIWSSARSRARNRISFGSPTSPSTAPARARSAAPSCWTCSPFVWSAGRSTRCLPLRW